MQIRFPRQRFYEYWTRLQDLNNDGNWTWMDGMDVDWNIMQSSNISTRVFKQEHGYFFAPRLCWIFIVVDNKDDKNRIYRFPKRRFAILNCAAGKLPFICKRSPDRVLNERPTNWRHYLPEDYYENLPSSCPEGFLDISSKCLRFNPANVTGLSWRRAQMFCAAHYGHQSALASFQDSSELLQLIAESSQNFSGSEYWIGLERRGSGSFLSWIDNSYLVVLPIIKSMSNNLTAYPFDNCIFLSYDDEFPKFTRGACRKRKQFICQLGKVAKRRNIQEIFNSSSCPDGYYGIDKTCYKFHSEEKTFDEAEIFCRKENNSHLTSVESHSENKLLQLLVEENNVTSIWVGLRIKHNLQQRVKVVSYWNDGQPIFYTNWIHEDGAHWSYKKNRCTEMTDGWTRSWKLASCEQRLSFVCKLVQEKFHSFVTSRDIFCPSFWYTFNGSCYYIHEGQDTTYQDAVKACIQLDTMATLGSVHTTMEKRAIKYFLQNEKNYPGLWTGTFIGKSGNSMNIDGSSRIDESLRREDRERQSDERCARLSWNEGTDSFNWTKCDKKYGFVCKMSPLDHPEIILSNISWDGCSSQKWIRRGEHCYLFLPDQYLTWRQAERKCASQEVESSLVSVQESRENHFIQVMMYEKSELSFHRWAWIGYRKDSKEEGNWGNWENFDSENRRAEDSLGSRFSCVALETTTGLWVLKPCDDLLGVVCKTPVYTARDMKCAAANNETDDFESTSADHPASENVNLVNSVDAVNTSNEIAKTSNQGNASSESHQSRILNIVFNTIVVVLLLIFCSHNFKTQEFLVLQQQSRIWKWAETRETKMW